MNTTNRTPPTPECAAAGAPTRLATVQPSASAPSPRRASSASNLALDTLQEITADPQALLKVSNWLELIKFSHTLFALPFALGAMWIAAGGWPGARPFALLLVAMVTARSCAMAFNRWADRHIDPKNPRTRTRPSCDGRIPPFLVFTFALNMAGIFLVTSAAINDLAFRLAPLALLILCGYSYTKRFTPWAHGFLGLALGLTPIAAQVVVQGSITWPFVLLGSAVACWVAGFDIIYATLDVDFDRAQRLHSIPARYGIARALWISRACHVGAAAGFFVFGGWLHLGPNYFLAAGAMTLALIVEQALVRANNLTRVNAAFFTANGWVSILFLLGTLFA